LSANTVYSLHVDAQGSVWVGTRGGGLDRVIGKPFGGDAVHFDNLSENEGLPNSTVYGIESDADGGLWISTNRGLAVVNPVDHQVRGFRRSHGLQGDEFNFGAHYRAADGTLYFGGSNGYNAFRPDRLQLNDRAPTVVLTHVLKLNRAVSPAPELLRQLDLGYRDSVVTFQFAALDYAGPAENRYAYRLKGFDADWVDADGARQATYTNLAGGNYEFQVRAANNDGLWTVTPASLRVRVAPPPWATWWARTALAGVLLAVVFFVWRGQQRRIEREAAYAQRLKREVDERTAELAERNRDMELANEQLRAASFSDTLTGLGNRRRLHASMSTWLNGSTVDTRARAVLMVIDLDCLKPINDQYGHEGGDAVLVQFAEILRREFRTVDLIVRWGGDEFIALCMDSDLESAGVLAERVRAAVSKRVFRVGSGLAVRTSCSIGFAPLPFIPDRPDLWVEWLGGAGRRAVHSSGTRRRFGGPAGAGLAGGAPASSEFRGNRGSNASEAAAGEFMSGAALLEAMPDVVAFIESNGVVSHHLGGRQVPFMKGAGDLAGRRLQDLLPPQVAALLNRLVKRAIADRAACESEFSVADGAYHVRMSAHGPRRALCVIRHVDPAQVPTAATKNAEARGFMRRLRRSLNEAALRERPLALCAIFLDGLADIGSFVDFSIREQIVHEMLRRLPDGDDGSSGPRWYVGHLGESVLGAIVEGQLDHDGVRSVVASICEVIAQPVQIHDATFHMTPYAGVAILGEDASAPEALLDHARAAMLEARRSKSSAIQFYSDTLRLLPVARLDIERELRRAIEDDQIDLRYVARHDLCSGEMAGLHAYMRWKHPLQDVIAPARFLPIANATGLAVPLSRAALERLVKDLPILRARHGEDVPISFGALRQHVTSGHLIRDCRRLASSSQCEFGRLELRIAERTLANLHRPGRALGDMVDFGARLVVDEMGRDFSSFASLAQLPIAALQIDRSLVVGASADASVARSCGAIAAAAAALDAIPIAAGIDDEAIRGSMTAAGCAQGLGDLYPQVADVAAVSAVPSMRHRQVDEA
jgi:diguanylate cyclase (GGDEF)-like protein